MKKFVILLSCLVLASLSRASQQSNEEKTPKHEDEIIDEIPQKDENAPWEKKQIQSDPLVTPIPIHPAVNVTCGQNEMWIEIPKVLLERLDVDHLRLRNVSCGATETSTTFLLHTKLTECRTRKRHLRNFVSYMNKVEEIPIGPNQIITRVREVEIPFSCYYSNTGVVSAVGIQVNSRKIVFSKKGLGRFVLELKIFPNSSYQNEFRRFPAVVYLRDILFVKLRVDTRDRRLEVFATYCFASPDPDPFKKGVPRYIFIRNGCSADETLEMIPTDDRRIQKFSLEAFAFVGDHPFVYMHCLVKVCRASNPNSRCAKGCIRGRGKRSAMVEDSTDDEAYLVQGPFELEQEPKKQDDETQIEKTIKEDQALEKSGKFPALVTAMAVVAAVCVLGVSYFAWDKRKQKPVRVYKQLTVPIQD